MCVGLSSLEYISVAEYCYRIAFLLVKLCVCFAIMYERYSQGRPVLQYSNNRGRLVQETGEVKGHVFFQISFIAVSAR